ncbi:MAG: hypothetical protein BIFFINMI_02046 [Phycisphaerae bacterium]|nr:hypothetical protein [Phycisphaerae bacterium]
MKRTWVFSAALAAILLFAVAPAQADGRGHVSLGGASVGFGGHGWNVGINLGGSYRGTSCGPAYRSYGYYRPSYGYSYARPYAYGYSTPFYYSSYGYYPYAAYYSYPYVSSYYSYPAVSSYYSYPATATYYSYPGTTTIYTSTVPAPVVAPAPAYVVYPYGGYARFSICW